MSKRAPQIGKQPPSLHVIRAILGLPRLTRILIAGVFALAVIVAVFPMVDTIYVQNFFSMDTRIVPSFVSAAAGLVMYLLGWWLMVGTVGEKPPARLAILWYVGTGMLIVLYVLALAIYGLATATAPTI